MSYMFIVTHFCSPATTSPGAPIAGTSTPFAARAGTRGRSRSSRWSACSTIDSSGSCRATGGRCICRRTRCDGAWSVAWRGCVHERLAVGCWPLAETCPPRPTANGQRPTAMTWLREFQAWVAHLGALGYVVYTLGYGVIGVFFPASILTLGAGALFGVVGGTIVVVFGATIAATLAFLLARTILRKRVEAMAAKNPKFRAVDRAIAREGAKIVVLVRLSAVFPFLFVNYAFGLTGIGLVPYVIATFLGILPAPIAFVWLGAAGAAVATQQSARSLITLIGAIVALGVSIYVGRIAARAIKRAGVDDESATA